MKPSNEVVWIAVILPSLLGVMGNWLLAVLAMVWLIYQVLNSYSFKICKEAESNFILLIVAYNCFGAVLCVLISFLPEYRIIGMAGLALVALFMFPMILRLEKVFKNVNSDSNEKDY